MMCRSRTPRAAFLGNKRIAVTGVSCNPKGHRSNVVYKRLRDRRYQVYAVNPNADQVEGDRSYHALKDIPGGVDAVVIATRPEVAEATMRESAELGIKQVWLHCPAFGRSRFPAGNRLWPGARHHRDRWRLPADVQPTADIGH